MDETTNGEVIPDKQPSVDLTEAAPGSSAEITTAFDRSTKSDDTPAGQAPASEPPVTEAEPRASINDKDLSFLRPGTRPGSLGRLAHYEVLEVLGEGGFGIVLKAFDEKLQRLVAIKVLGSQLAGSPSARTRFVREARLAAAVNSKHVVSTYAVNEQPIPYLVMEYVSGVSLQHRIDQGRVETREILRIGAEIAEGLAAAHEKGLIHRDIKPANILLAVGSGQWAVGSKTAADSSLLAVGSGQWAAGSKTAAHPSLPTAHCPLPTVAKLADFGLARAVDDTSMTQTGVIAGTPMFMSPEQARGDALDHRSDLFSLGSVLYTMCTGQLPFRAHKTLGVLKRVCDDTPRPIRELNADIPATLAAVVNRLLVKDPAGRYQSAAEVADVFKQQLDALDNPLLASPSPELVGAETTEHVPYVSADVNPVPKPARQRWKWMAAALVLPLIALTLTEILGVTHLFQDGSTSVDEKQKPALGDASQTKTPLTPDLKKPIEKEPVDGPPETEGNPLKNAKVGDWAEYKMTGSVNGSDLDETITMEVTALSQNTARIKLIRTAQGRKIAAYEQELDLTKPYDPTSVANLPSDSNAKVETVGSGKEITKVSEKEFETSWQHVKVTAKAGRFDLETSTKFWTSRKAPLGRLVKMETTIVLKREAIVRETKMTLEVTGSGNKVPPSEARSHAARGDWSAAAAGYARVFASHPLEDGEVGFEYATVLVLSGDQVGYRKICAEMLERSGQSDVRPYHVARSCTLSPDAVKDAAAAAKKAEQELQQNNWAFWSLTEQGALAYRAGRYDEAVPLLEKSLQDDGRPARAVLNWLWLSMVEHRRGKPAQAKAWLDKATLWLDEHKTTSVVPDDAAGMHLHNWMEAIVLHREAMALLAPKK